jgi:peptide-N4-(N-acetyl-beta-glucosaminyl)asparagine amidase
LHHVPYFTNHVADETDHVWTEVWSAKESRWLHADSCENILDEPKLYEAGWGKKLTYVVAVGAGCVQDVTRRYVVKFEDTLSRRTYVDERWLDAELRKLNAVAVAALPAAERASAIFRNDTDCEALRPDEGQQGDGRSIALPGRQSGSEEWVRQRGEDGK